MLSVDDEGDGGEFEARFSGFLSQSVGIRLALLDLSTTTVKLEVWQSVECFAGDESSFCSPQVSVGKSSMALYTALPMALTSPELLVSLNCILPAPCLLGCVASVAEANKDSFFNVPLPVTGTRCFVVDFTDDKLSSGDCEPNCWCWTVRAFAIAKTTPGGFSFASAHRPTCCEESPFETCLGLTGSFGLLSLSKAGFGAGFGG